MNKKILLARFKIREYDLCLGTGILDSYLKKKGYNVTQAIFERPDKLILEKYSISRLIKKKPSRKIINNQANINYTNFRKTLIRKAMLNYSKMGNLPLMWHLDNAISKIRNYDVVGFSLMANTDLLPCLTFARRIKERFGSTIVFGGAFIKLYHKHLIKYKFIDYLVTGDGGPALDGIMQYLDGKMSITEIPSIIHVKSEQKNPIKTIKLDETPLPNFPVKMMNEVKRGNDYPNNFGLPFELIRGCTNKCGFCPLNSIDRCEFRNIEKAVDQIIELRDIYKFHRFRFIASSTNMNPKYLDMFCDELIKRKVNVEWVCHVTPNMNQKLIANMKKAGCINVLFGIESANIKTSKNMNKTPKINTAEKCIKKTSEAGIKVDTTFMIGFPHDYGENLNDSIEFIIRNKQYLDNIFLFRFNLREQTIMYNEPNKFGIRIKSSISEYEPEIHKFDEIGGLNWNEKLHQTEKQIAYFQNKLSDAGIKSAVSYTG